MSDQAKDERAPDETKAAEAPRPRRRRRRRRLRSLVRLLKANDELMDRALRVAAEMVNLRRRTARDVHDARSYAIANFARGHAVGLRQSARAPMRSPPRAGQPADTGFKALVDGVEITERAMLSALEQHGVKKLEPHGEKFDPNFPSGDV